MLYPGSGVGLAVGLSGDGPRDELTRFTRAITGAYYVIPSMDRLAKEWAYAPHSGERLNIFLTNTLEGLERTTSQLPPLRSICAPCCSCSISIARSMIALRRASVAAPNSKVIFGVIPGFVASRRNRCSCSALAGLS